MCDELGPKESYLRPALGRVMGLSDRRAVEAWASDRTAWPSLDFPQQEGVQLPRGIPLHVSGEWVEEFASLCDANATDKKGCSDQQVKFIERLGAFAFRWDNCWAQANARF